METGRCKFHVSLFVVYSQIVICQPGQNCASDSKHVSRHQINQRTQERTCQCVDNWRPDFIQLYCSWWCWHQIRRQRTLVLPTRVWAAACLWKDKHVGCCRLSHIPQINVRRLNWWEGVRNTRGEFQTEHPGWSVDGLSSFFCRMGLKILYRWDFYTPSLKLLAINMILFLM